MAMRKHVTSLILACALMLILSAAAAFASTEAGNGGIMRIPLNSSKILKIDETVKRVAVGNSGIVEYTMVTKNEILLLGLKTGRTEFNIWLEGAPETTFKSYIIYVYDDIVELKSKILEIMGDKVAGRISVYTAKEMLVIKGNVASAYESEQVEKIAKIYYNNNVLNLLEIKAPPAPKQELAVTKKLSPGPVPAQTAATEPAALPAPAQPVANPGAAKDILEISELEKIEKTEFSYGAGANPETAAEALLPTMMLKKSDYDRANSKSTKVITLQNAVATEVLAALEKVKSADGTIVKDDRTNSLILIDKPSMIDKMNNLVKVLDAPVPQVLIEAKIIEVGLNDDMTNTLNWIYDTLYSGTNPLGSALNNKSIKMSNGDLELALDYGKISSDHFTTKILPSLKNRHARLLSSPSTVTLDRKEAIFAVTDNIPYLKYTPQGTTGTLLPTPEFVTPAPGITLKVTPTINQTEIIRMNLSIMIGSFVENVSFGQYGTVPRTSSRSTTNIVEVKNGETLIISGLMTNNVFKSANKVPFLAKLPVVGKLFSNKITGQSRTELVIFITPKMVGKDSRFAKVDQEKFPRIAENKYPEVDDEFTMSEIFGDKPEKDHVRKTTLQETVIPKVEKPAAFAPVKPAAAVPAPPAVAQTDQPVTAAQPAAMTEKPVMSKKFIAPRIAEESPACPAKTVTVTECAMAKPAAAVEPAPPAAERKAAISAERPRYRFMTPPPANVKFAYRDDRTQQMIENIRKKVGTAQR